MNLLVGFTLGYTPNFNFLGHLEVPKQFEWWVGGGGWWWVVVGGCCKQILVFSFRPLIKLNNV